MKIDLDILETTLKNHYEINEKLAIDIIQACKYLQIKKFLQALYIDPTEEFIINTMNNPNITLEEFINNIYINR